MFDTPVINVAIGLVFCFAAVSLAASTLTEALASLVKLRANTLVTGIQSMLNDPGFNGLALAVYQHALVHPQGDGAMKSNSRWWTYDGPSYIRPDNFATALVDVLQKTPGDMVQLKTSIEDIADPQIKLLLQGIVARAGGSVSLIEKQVVNWFDSSMDRVSGAYKRQAQMICFLCGLLLAATMNVDATRVVAELWANPARAQAVAVLAEKGLADRESLKPTLARLEQLPVGWDASNTCKSGEAGCLLGTWRVQPQIVLGWLITAVASVFGAPFWFDMLGKLVKLRGAGPKPGEKP
jgi:hypothetical protein